VICPLAGYYPPLLMMATQIVVNDPQLEPLKMEF